MVSPREASIEDCRSKLQVSCGIDILSWFQTSPNPRQVLDNIILVSNLCQIRTEIG